jgi:heat shock protein HtpX
MLANSNNDIPFIYKLPEPLNKNEVKAKLENRGIAFTETIFQNYNALELYLKDINARVVIIPENEPMVIVWSNGNIRIANQAYETIRSMLYTVQQNVKVIAFLFTDKHYIVERSKTKNVMIKIFLGNPIAMVGILILIATIGFFFLGFYLPIVLVLGQFMILLISDKILLRMSDYTITEDDRHAHIVECLIPDNEYAKSLTIISKNKVEIKREIYEQTLKINNKIDTSIISSILNKYGINVIDVKVTSIDVYKLVDEVRKSFNINMPKVTLMNTTISNAAASGISKKHAIIVITIGLLMSLKEDEIKAVLAHEFSHIVNHDPMIISSIFSLEYLIRIFVTLNIPILLGYLYLIFSFTTVFFIAKFFEERADLMGAYYINNTTSLKEALKRIGYRRLMLEKDNASRVYAWLKWFDAHPPISYRIERLNKNVTKEDLSLKNIARECISDLFNNIKFMLQPFPH